MMLRHYILDADNHVVPCDDFLAWARWLDDIGNCVVGYTQITSETFVSTVFLGLDHRYFGAGPPIVFETMIFGGPLDQSCWRYSSFDDATTGHASAVRKAREAIGQKVQGGHA